MGEETETGLTIIEQLALLHDIDVEKELCRILIEEINKEIANDYKGTYVKLPEQTWQKGYEEFYDEQQID